MNCPPKFREDLFHVLYEADPEAVQEMAQARQSSLKENLGDHVILPYCLGAKKGKGKLHVTANPYASSLFEPNPYMHTFYAEIKLGLDICDVTYDDMLEVKKIIEVETFSLDQLATEDKIPNQALPDFLSLDTQGAELQIIQGGTSTIRQNVLAILTEIEIIPMYRDQPLLADMLTSLNGLGFLFAGFTYHQEVAQYRAPIGLRGRGFPGFGDGLFLRKLETLREISNSDSHLYLMANKLAFIAVNFGHIEYGLKALELAATVQPKSDLRAQLHQHYYFRFLEEFEATAKGMVQMFPPLFGLSSTAIQTQERIRHLIFSRPHIALLKIIRHLGIVPQRLWTRLIEIFPQKPFGTPVEKLLQRQGFHDVAKLVRRRRLEGPLTN